MSEFESTSLLWAKVSAYGGAATAIAAVLTLIVAVIALVVAYGQLKQLVQQVSDGKENIRSLTEQVEAAVEANKLRSHLINV